MKSVEQDLTRGPLGRQIIRFSIPLILSNVLQMLFNLADMAVVGRFAGADALGAVGSTSTLAALFTAFLVGMGGGANVVIARYLGAKADRDVHETVHTSFVLCAAVGLFVMTVGLTLSPTLLALMRTKEELIDGAVTYLRIYSLGMPAVALYQFGRAAFSAMGETKRPFYFLLAAGALNLALNLLFVIVFRMSVAGVAIASVLSEYLSAALIIGALIQHDGACALAPRKARLYHDKARAVLGLGLTGGIQDAAFAIANLVLQISINYFPKEVVSGHSAALNADTITFAIIGAFWTAGSSFMSQNLGAGDKKRFHRAYFLCMLYSLIVGVACGGLFIAFGRQFLSLFTTDPEVIEWGLYRLFFLGIAYPFSVVYDTTITALRSMGKKLGPMLIAFFCIVVFRIVWMLTIFEHYHTLPSLYLLYLCSFVLCGITESIYFAACDRKYWAADRSVRPGNC